MQHERFGGVRNLPAKDPTAEELRIAEEAYAEADPTTYSTLPIHTPLEEKGTIEYYGYKILTDGIDTYYALPESAHPQKQQIVQRLLKGIVNVSDLVFKSDGETTAYVSKEVALEKVQKSISDEEIYADLALLTDLFDDSDHSYYPKDPRGYGIPQHNLIYTKGKVSYYDFSETSISERDYRLNHPRETVTSLEYELEKISQLTERFKGEDGRQFFFAILKDSDAEVRALFPYVFEGVTNSMDSDEEYFYTVFMNRLQHLSKILRDLMTKKQEVAERAEESAS